jgi:hypothetical protein
VADLVGGFVPLLRTRQARRGRKRVGVDEFVDEVRDAHFRISNGPLPTSPSVSLGPIKSWWNRPTRLATGSRSYAKAWGIDFVGENWVRLAKFVVLSGIKSEIKA